MWIPDSEGPQMHNEREADIKLAIVTSAQALAAARGLRNLMEELYRYIISKLDVEVPALVKVSTHHYKGDGIQITAVQAYYLNELGFLGEQENRSKPGYGMTGYTRYFSWRMLDMVKLYEFLSDETIIPRPQEKITAV